jgi:1-acyl-sn-glycerol-3-phosphate acyltransferase
MRIVVSPVWQCQPLQESAGLSISPAVESGSDAFSRRESDPLFRFLRAWAGGFARTWHQTSVLQPCRLPPRGPAILVCNHTSSPDPIVLQAFSPRLIRWMMAKEYFEYQPMRWVFSAMGVILVERSGHDMASIRQAMRILKAGYVLGVFPEGRIETSMDLIPFQSGIGLLALKTRAPIYPAYLDGTQRNREMLEAFLRPSAGFVAFGEPLDLADLPDTKQAAREATRRIQTAVDDLKDRFSRRSRV